MNVLDECNLRDLEYRGDMFTWSNKQKALDQINERLDRFMANEAFWSLFPNLSITHFDWARFDHRPILLDVMSIVGPEQPRYRNN